MRLLSAVLGFLLRKLGLLGVLLLALFLGYLLVQALVPTVREAVQDRERLEQTIEDRRALEEDLAQLRDAVAEGQSATVTLLQDRVGAAIERGARDVAQKRDEVERLRADQDEACGLLDRAIAVVLPGDPCETARLAAEKAGQALDVLEANLARALDEAAVLADPALSPEDKLEQLGQGAEQSLAERRIEATESELAQKQAEQESLEEAQSSGVGWVVDQWARSWRWLALIAVVVLAMPVILRFLGYFVLMPVVRRTHTPIHLAAGSARTDAAVRTSQATRSLTVVLGPGEVLSARSEHVRPVQGTVRSRILYDWSSPFISFAAGLYGLSRVTGDELGTAVTLATPDDPDAYLMRIDFGDHPGMVMRPRHVVGVIGAPELVTRWRWGIQALATWQVRYIMFAGTGSLIVEGSGDVTPTDPGGRSTRIEQTLVMGFDSRLLVGVNRTEVFIPYLWGRTPLVDDEFTGAHPLFWQKSTTDGPTNPVARTFDALFSALGKLLGF